MIVIALAAASLFTSACGSRRAAATVPSARIGASQEGVASWYGEPYHGRRAANGEIYDMDKPTAAHPSLPFETWVRVRSLDNNKNTDVRITDRGPFAKGRIIDLSRAAAREIDLIRNGTARVRITVIEPPRSYLNGRQFTIQVSSLPSKPRAELLQKQLAPRFPNVAVRYRPPNPKGGHAEAWRVLVGREPSPDAARRLLLDLQDRFPNAFVVPWDTD
jgi:rare lipoprotein A